jgi:hypothetical protein
MSRLSLAAAAAGMFLALGTAAAIAAPAVASTTVNVRSGPGTGYGVVDVLRPGEPVDVSRCQGTWCYVARSGPDGWVSAAYLDADRPTRLDRYDDYDDGFYIDGPRYRPYRPYRFHRYDPFYSHACVGGKNVTFCVGGY